MKEINWGWRIALLYGGFVVFMLFLVWNTTTVKDDLVSPDYYAKELRYQEHLDKQQRTRNLSEQPVWMVNKESVSIQFPTEMLDRKINADILFYNPAEAKRDVRISCSPDSAGICLVSSDKLARGIYQMRIDWSAGGVSYYNEGIINIQ